MKILMLAPTPYFADRGCHVRIYEEARTLKGMGHDVRIVTYHLGRDMPGIPTFRTIRVPWYKKLAAGPSWHKPYLDVLLFFRALRVARSFGPELIHAHLHEGAYIGGYLKRALGVPLLFDCQGSLTTEMTDHGFVSEGSLLYRFFARIEARINRVADFMVTSSTAGARELTGRWRVPADKVRPLIDGVDTGVFRPYPKEEVRAKLRIPRDARLVVYLGLLNSYQGIDALLSGMVLLKSRGTRFLVMGFPEESYRAKARELGVDGMVTFTGRIDYAKAAACLSAGDIAVSPKLSLTEANGKLFNYMACALPTVAFDTPVNREILGDAGVYARYGDSHDLVDRMEELLDNQARRDELAIAVRQRAEELHSWRARGEELVAIYRNVIRRSGRARRG